MSDIDFVKDIRQKLYESADEKYRLFSMSLTPGADNVIGVRLPVLRKIAKEIAKSGSWRDYLNSSADGIFEEKMLRGMVIGYAKVDFEEKLKLIEDFLPLIDTWSICDSFCSTLKNLKCERERLFEFLSPYFLSENEYYVRFAVVMLFTCFSDREWLERDFEKLSEIRHDGYYVKMAAAWALSIFFVTDSELTKRFLESGKVDDETVLKAIGKIRDSYRVSTQDKQYAFELREKIKSKYS